MFVDISVNTPADGLPTLTANLAGNGAIVFTQDATTTSADAVLSITSLITSLAHSATATVTFDFDKSVTGFTTSDVSVSGGTKGAFTGSGDSYSVIVTAPASGSGNVVISVSADVVSEGNNADSLSIPYS